MSIGTFLLIGMGGLGSPLAMALAASGADRLVLVDDDVVELSNLQRQILFRTQDVGRPKVDAAKDALVRRGFPSHRIDAIRVRFDESNARNLAHDADVVCDGTDSADTKFLTNDLGLALNLPFVIAGAVESRGQVFPVRPDIDACYRCLFEAPPEAEALTCASAGILGATCGQVAAKQARAALALATGSDPHAVLGRGWLLEDAAWRAISDRL